MRSLTVCLLLSFSSLVAAQRPAPTPRPITWATLEERMKSDEAAGFSGAVLVVREGKVVLDQGYGLANREKNVRCTSSTVFGIGSTPIDFTKAGILLLAESGQISLDDPLAKFFADAPADKRAITIAQLMSGRSGLPDFHDVPSDRDKDHSWIDRDEAVRRILAQKLLFEPGKGEQHSHSAWGLLAALIEVVSGQSYPEFTRANLFEPAGMKDTGFFGEPIAAERLAIAYGPRTDGELNAPPYWGKTSWLVMGSGGQVSTTGDMLRWLQALRAGKILDAESTRRYFGPDDGGPLVGGDMYGFFILYTQGPKSLVILISNSAAPGKYGGLGEDLARLVNGR
ncbi:MAG: class A beta-lactamase-related serine hydrolase [Planctomycetes bacterium]|nr:class A beta-lactamase-related serine hydrolase [Planctomycetota bacterium]